MALPIGSSVAPFWDYIPLKDPKYDPQEGTTKEPMGNDWAKKRKKLVTMLAVPAKALAAKLTKSHDPLSTGTRVSLPKIALSIASTSFTTMWS